MGPSNGRVREPGLRTVTRGGDVLHQGADQGLPAGLAQCLGGFIVRKEAISKILLLAKSPIESGDEDGGGRCQGLEVQSASLSRSAG